MRIFLALSLVAIIAMGCGEPEPGAGATNVAPEVEKTDAGAPQGSSTMADVRTD
ncbi:MAG TPA: hypothetical protein PLX06_05515 [Fimbriimonadaceae bacterium]|nr:hypothetical protein [Fimbriimonadaceae bacterium]